VKRSLIALAASCAVVASAAAASNPVETAIEAPGPSGPLKGTMLAPEAGGTPVVLIIPGSGPTDRDGNSPAGITAATPDANVTINDYVTDVLRANIATYGNASLPLAPGVVDSLVEFLNANAKSEAKH
jgi:hypothetical protein